jgi:hexokinase
VVLALVLALALQSIAPHLTRDLVQNLSARTQHLHLYLQPRNPIPHHNNGKFAHTFYTHTTKSMALAEQAKRVAAEFDFDQDHVRSAVKEFIREMGMSATVPAAPKMKTQIQIQIQMLTRGR